MGVHEDKQEIRSGTEVGANDLFLFILEEVVDSAASTS